MELHKKLKCTINIEVIHQARPPFNVFCQKKIYFLNGDKSLQLEPLFLERKWLPVLMRSNIFNIQLMKNMIFLKQTLQKKALMMSYMTNVYVMTTVSVFNTATTLKEKLEVQTLNLLVKQYIWQQFVCYDT